MTEPTHENPRNRVRFDPTARELSQDVEIDPTPASDIAESVGIQSVHEIIVHRVDRKGRVKIADFGLAKLLGRGPRDVTLTEAFQALGTMHYMAPEQWVRSKRVGVEADLYSVGVLWFQMLAGRLPFVAQEAKDLMFCHVVEAPPLDLLEGVAPLSTRALIERLLARPEMTAQKLDI